MCTWRKSLIPESSQRAEYPKGGGKGGGSTRWRFDNVILASLINHTTAVIIIPIIVFFTMEIFRRY